MSVEVYQGQLISFPSDNRSPRFSILTGGRKVSVSYTIYDSGYRLFFTLYTSFDWEELGSLWWEQELARRRARQGPGLQGGSGRHQWPSPQAGRLTSQSFSVPSTATPLIYYSHWVPSLHHPSFCLHSLRICLETLTRISQGWWWQSWSWSWPATQETRSKSRRWDATPRVHCTAATQ